MLQWAFYLGFEKVYVIGVDHNYGDLPKIFPPGKIKITEDNISKVRQVHFSSSYYKVGDVMGVPDVEFQNRSYSLANEVFRKDSRAVLNAGIDSKLEAFERTTEFVY